MTWPRYWGNPAKKNNNKIMKLNYKKNIVGRN